MRRKAFSQTVVVLKFDNLLPGFDFLPHTHQAMLDERKGVHLAVALAKHIHRKIELHFSFV
jgi:hypothetical protein